MHFVFMCTLLQCACSVMYILCVKVAPYKYISLVYVSNNIINMYILCVVIYVPTQVFQCNYFIETALQILVLPLINSILLSYEFCVFFFNILFNVYIQPFGYERPTHPISSPYARSFSPAPDHGCAQLCL